MCDYLFAQRGHRILSLHCMCFTRLNYNYTSSVICDRCYYRRFSTISKRIWIVCSFNLGSVGKYARRGDSKSQARSYRYFRWCVNNFLKMFFLYYNTAVFDRRYNDIAFSVCLSAPYNLEHQRKMAIAFQSRRSKVKFVLSHSRKTLQARYRMNSKHQDHTNRYSLRKAL